MRLPSASSPALAFTIAAFAITLHAQTGTAAPQYGSGMGGSASSGNSGAAARMGAGGGVIAIPEDFSKLKIQPGFLLEADVFDEPDLSGQYRVGPDGNVNLPFAGAVHVAGDTQAEARQRIQESFKTAQILKNPQVTLDILQYAPTLVTVLGEVNNPGRLQMLAPHSLLDVLSFAGGETQVAGGEIEVRHETDGKTETATYHYGRNSNGDTISDVMVHDGDTVIVPRAGIVYVLGAVTRPGGYLMQEDGKLDVMQAISLAWGTMLQAKTSEIRVIRRKPDGTFTEFSTSYRDIASGKVTPLELQAQDIVYVPMSRAKILATTGMSIIEQAAVSTVYVGDVAK
ncbi:MAG: polysaccharide biosynthesis/export family protein [Terracidiphilus sp.]